MAARDPSLTSSRLYSVTSDDDDDDEDGDAPASKIKMGDSLGLAIASSIYRLRIPFVIAWPILAVIMMPFSYLLLLRASPLSKTPPKNTPSTQALEVFKEHFPALTAVRREMIEFRCKEVCDTADTAMTKGLVYEVVDKIKRLKNEQPDMAIDVSSFYSLGGHDWVQVSENPMLSISKQAILLQWMWTVPPLLKWRASSFIDEMNELIAELNAFQGTGQGMNIALTGFVSLDHALTETLIEEIPVHEVSTIWLPFIILAFALQSARMLLLALIPMGIEIPVAFGLMYFVSLHSTVLIHALMMMLLLCTSLSFDYSLFTLTRYAEERANGLEVVDSILIVISQQGRVVVVSGIVLLIAWCAMLALPSPFNTFCIASSVMIMVCVVVQLTFTPSLLAILPWLGPPAKEIDASARRRSSSFTKAEPHMRGIGFVLGKWLTKFPCNILIPFLIFLAMMPLTIRMGKNFDISKFKFEMGHSYEMNVPRTRDEWHTALRIQHDFPNSVGILMPMLIIATNALPEDLTNYLLPMTTIVPLAVNLSGNQSILPLPTLPPPPTLPTVTPKLDVRGQHFYDANCRMIDSLIAGTEGKPHALRAESFVSPTFHGMKSPDKVNCIQSWQIDLVRTNYFAKNWFLADTSKNLQMLWNQLVSKGHHAMVTFVFPTMDPFGPRAFDLMRDVRLILENVTLEARAKGADIPGLTFMTFSPASILMDLIAKTSDNLPRAFVICVGICLILIAFWFNSVVIPFKLVLTVVVPISWTYGMALYVYEDGLLNFTNFPGLMPTGAAGGLDWTVPIFTLTFIVGLAMDYEIFLIERVLEFRQEGFGDNESIQLGLAATGNTITCAGLIMAFTFTAQLLASIPCSNQIGFVLVFSIVVDTFIVRTVLVPAMLSLGSQFNYWPSTMPEVRYHWLAKGYTPQESQEARSQGFNDSGGMESESDDDQHPLTQERG